MKQERVYLWDNLKFILILLVVIGHFVDYYISSNIFKSIYLFIYAFHMPLFIYIGGVFHKNENIISKIISYVTIGFLYKAGIFFLKVYVKGGNPVLKLFSEKSVPWYMFALAMFIAVTYVLQNVNKKLVLICSLVISLLAGYDSTIGDGFVLSRFFVFFPFYYLGTITERNTIEKFDPKLELKIIAIVCFIIWGGLCLFKLDKVYILRSFFTGRNPYLGQFAHNGILLRCIQYIMGVLFSAALVIITPRREIPVVSKLGTKTLQIYFWHRILLSLSIYSGIATELFNTRTGKCIYLLMGILMTFMLGHKIFSFPTDYICKLAREKRG